MEHTIIWQSLKNHQPEYLSSIDSEFFCPLCYDLLSEPYLSPCGHNFCLSCLNKILLSKNNACPFDQELLNDYKPFLNKHFQKKISQLKIKCPNFSEVCKWQGLATDLSKHMDECKEAMFCCPLNCGQFIKKKAYEEHLTQNMSCHFFELIKQNEALKINQRLLGEKQHHFEQEFHSMKLKLDAFLNQQEEKQQELSNSPPAKSIIYTLLMSSKYNGPPNTYEALQTDEITQGAGTQALPQSFIEAQFPQKVRVSKLTLAGPAGMSGGWNCAYTNGTYFQYSNDRNNWIDVFRVEGVPDGVKTFGFEPIVAQYWRLFNKDNTNSGYVATGVFRFE